MQKIIGQGAEAKIILDEKNNLVIKNRVPKSYRLKELDEKIRKRRTKSEKKLLEKACKIIDTPNPFPLEGFDKIKMPFIQGKKLSVYLDEFPLKKQKQILKIIGEEIAKLHDADIIHGDLTTSNMILTEEEKVFFIDFGLGYISKKIEDKAVDLHLLKHALEAKHFREWKTLFEEFKKGYKKNKEAEKILEKLIAVEKRGRYKEH
jgi:TP53 regulating kinase-like protein